MPTEPQILRILADAHRDGTLPWHDMGDALQLGRVRPVPRDRVSASVAARARRNADGTDAEASVLLRGDLADGTMAILELDVDAFLRTADAIRAHYRS